jgi:hypothetical protein
MLPRNLLLILFFSFVGVFGLMSGARADAATLTVAWDAEAAAAGFVVSVGTQPGVYTTRIDVGNTTVETVPDLVDGTLYYIVVQSYDAGGNLSDPSSEISGQTSGIAPPPPPTNSLSMNCPTPPTASSSDGNPIAVSFDDPAVAGGVSPVTTTCTPASGTQFPVGSNALTCTATDAAQQTASCSSVVVVLSTVPPPVNPPTITCPQIPMVVADASQTAVVTFGNPQVAGGAAPVTASCSPPSGSVFNAGISNVVCTVVDALQQTASCIAAALVQPLLVPRPPVTSSGAASAGDPGSQPPDATSTGVSDPGTTNTPTPVTNPVTHHKKRRKA